MNKKVEINHGKGDPSNAYTELAGQVKELSQMVRDQAVNLGNTGKGAGEALRRVSALEQAVIILNSKFSMIEQVLAKITEGGAAKAD